MLWLMGHEAHAPLTCKQDPDLAHMTHLVQEHVVRTWCDNAGCMPNQYVHHASLGAQPRTFDKHCASDANSASAASRTSEGLHECIQLQHS